jgi:hypothetical protein
MLTLGRRKLSVPRIARTSLPVAIVAILHVWILPSSL